MCQRQKHMHNFHPPGRRSEAGSRVQVGCHSIGEPDYKWHFEVPAGIRHLERLFLMVPARCEHSGSMLDTSPQQQLGTRTIARRTAPHRTRPFSALPTRRFRPFIIQANAHGIKFILYSDFSARTDAIWWRCVSGWLQVRFEFKHNI